MRDITENQLALNQIQDEKEAATVSIEMSVGYVDTITLSTIVNNPEDVIVSHCRYSKKREEKIYQKLINKYVNFQCFMNHHCDKLVSEITVRLRLKDSPNTSFGTGVLYYENLFDDKIYVLTTSHCLFEDGDMFKKRRTCFYIDILNPNTNCYLSILYNLGDENLLNKNDKKDVAVLVLDKAEVESINPNIPFFDVICEYQSFKSFAIKGFPQATRGVEIDAIQASWKQVMTESNRFQLQLKEDYTEFNMKGFSGSGIFLEANDKVYLLGIFSRFRAEEKGKVIYCQYIDTINELLSQNFLPTITYSYLGKDGLTPSFFTSKIEKAVKDLGSRFHKELSLDLPIAKIFNCIAYDNTYYDRLIMVADKWLTEKGYRNKSNNTYLSEIECELESLRNELKDWIISSHHNVINQIEISQYVNKVTQLDKKVSVKKSELYRLNTNQKGKLRNSILDEERNRLYEIQDHNSDFLNGIEELKINLANNPTLIIKGEAGCGKSHLLGDIALQRNMQNLPTILLLGQYFNASDTIENNITKQLGISCCFASFAENLNNIGLQINSRVLILIDAINEGPGVDLWKNQIAGFINEIARYPAVGLVLTIRSTYFRDIIPEHLRKDQNITFISHEGFKGNEYEALKLFCEYYKLKLPNFPILNPEYTNPLFLHLICETAKDSPEKAFPKGFNGIVKTYNQYKQSLDQRFEKKRNEYKLRKVVSNAIEKLSIALFDTKYGQMKIEDALELFVVEFPKYPNLLSDLIEESVFIKSRNDYGREEPYDVVYFSFQRIGDYFMADELLKPYTSKVDIENAFIYDAKFKKIIEHHQWAYRGIIEAFAILLPERYNLEIFEIIDFFIEKGDEESSHSYKMYDTYSLFDRFLFDSLQWREVCSIDDKKITNWLRLYGRYIDDNEWLYTLTGLTTIHNHPFNSDRLHRILKRFSLPKRDSILQEYIRGYSKYNDYGIAFPIKRLIDWSWSSNISFEVDPETARLTAQTLSWILSTTDIVLRDQTTKALVNLLEQQPDVLLLTLKAFKKVDDPYIIERLWAVAYGCVLRIENVNSIIKIAKYTYKSIFKDGNPPKHILLRDYARNIIEYALYKGTGLKSIDIDLVRPPYRSEMPTIPSKEDIHVFELDYDSKDYMQNFGRQQNKIIHSVSSEMSHFCKYEVVPNLNHFYPTSFKTEINYKPYLKSLSKKKRDQIRIFEKLYKSRNLLKPKSNNFYYGFNKKEKDDFDKQIRMIDEKIEQQKKDLYLIFEQNEWPYLFNEIIPFIEFKNNTKGIKLDREPIIRWIIKKVFDLGWERKLHGKYDDSAGRYYGYSNDGYKVDRIGKKYQWIALYEVLAILTDNYKVEVDWGDNFMFYKGAWQHYLRDIDPAFITPNKDHNEENSFKSGLNCDWWKDDDYCHWNIPDAKWVKTISDLVDPKKVILKKDNEKEEWLHLQHYLNWQEPKKIGKEKYEGRRKSISYLVEGYLVKKSDKNRIVNYLKDKNFWGRWMPENRDDSSGLINREKFWSPAYQDSYSNNQKIWDTIRDTSFKVIETTESAKGSIEDDKSGANGTYDIPCKYLFEGMKLQYAPIDGCLKNEKGETIVINNNPRGVLIKKKALLQFLNDNNLEIFWTVLCEKFSYSDGRNDESFFKVPCGVYYFENGKIVGELKMYNRE